MAMSQVCRKWRVALLASEVAWSFDMRMNVRDEEAFSGLACWLAHRPGAKLAHLALGPVFVSCQETADALQRTLGPHSQFINTLVIHACDLLGAAAFGAFPSLTGLSLNFNDGVLRRDFAELSSLKRLILSPRSVALEPGCLPGSLQSLTIENSHIATSLDTFLPSASALTSLSLHQVHFRTEGWDPLSAVWAMTWLQRLEITHYRYCEVWPIDVSKLVALTYLSFEGTAVGVGENQSVESLTSLQSLNLSNCRIRHLPEGTLSSLPYLHTLKIHSNPRLAVTEHCVWMLRHVELDLVTLASSLEQVFPSVSSFIVSESLVESIRVWPIDTDAFPTPSHIHAAMPRTLNSLKRMPRLKKVSFVEGTLDGVLSQLAVGGLVDLVRERPDVHVEIEEIM